MCQNDSHLPYSQIMPISVTHKACSRINQILANKFGLLTSTPAVQLSVLNKGCAGHAYQLQFHPCRTALSNAERTAQPRPPLVEVLDTGTFSLLVDKSSLAFLVGSEIDWKEDDMSSKFVFKNPNATKSCSCGNSFSA